MTTRGCTDANRGVSRSSLRRSWLRLSGLGRSTMRRSGLARTNRRAEDVGLALSSSASALAWSRLRRSRLLVQDVRLPLVTAANATTTAVTLAASGSSVEVENVRSHVCRTVGCTVRYRGRVLLSQRVPLLLRPVLLGLLLLLQLLLLSGSRSRIALTAVIKASAGVTDDATDCRVAAWAGEHARA